MSDPGIPRDSSGRMFALVAALVLLTALGFRAWNLDWDLPALSEEAAPVHEALRMWGFESGQPTLDPGTAGWPAPKTRRPTR